MIAANQLLLIPQGMQQLKEGVYRVVLIATREDSAAVFWIGSAEATSKKTLGTHTRKPKLVQLKTLNNSLERNQIQIISEIPHQLQTNSQRQRESAAKRFAKNWEILFPLVEPDKLQSMLIYGTWSKETKLHASTCKVSSVTVHRLLSRYFTLQMNIEWACEDRLWFKGARRNITKKLGRPAERFKTQHNLLAQGRNATDADRTAVAAFYDSLEQQNISIARMYADFKHHFLPKRFIIKPEGGYDLVRDESQTCITESQFRYALAKTKGELALLTDQAGNRRINLSHRPALGSAKDRIPFPGHTYIVDATVADVYLVSAFDRTRIIGRPVIYLVVDAFSSLIVSIHVSLSGPNFEEARIAMHRALADKTRWLQWLGIPEVIAQLPQGCLPTFWLVDRGELHSKANRALQTELRCNLSIAAAYRADWKSLVERLFGILNTQLIHWIPGAVTQRMRERGAPDCRLDAVLTLKEFTRILARKAAILNLTRDMSRHLSSPMIAGDVTPNPLGFFQHGIVHKHGSAVFLDYEQSIRKTLRIESAMIDRHGMQFNKQQYSATWMQDHPFLRLAGFKGPSPIKAIKSPDDPLSAWCFLPDETGMREVRLSKGFERAQQYSCEDIQEMTALRKFLGQDLRDETDPDKEIMEAMNIEEINIAKKKTQSELKKEPASKSSRTKNIRKNREAELGDNQHEPTTESQNRNTQTSSNEEGNIESPPTMKPSSKANNDYYERISAQLKGWGTQ